MLETVHWPIDGSATFPSRCLLCDREYTVDPEHVSEMTRKLGRLLVRLRCPVCPRCEALRRKRRVLWVVAFLAYTGMSVGTISLLQRSGFGETHGSVLFWVTCLFVGTCFGWFIREEAIFLRRYTRIWIHALGKPGKTLILASEDAKLIAELREIVDHHSDGRPAP